MQAAEPSRTALRVALRRAAHQLYDRPLVLDDPIAVPLLGSVYAEELRRTPLQPGRTHSTALRAFLVGRSRYAEDVLALAAQRGVGQYVLLGAGLDTFAYRNPFSGLRVFEVDHPATQQWKRDLLQAARIAAPPSLTFIPVDFEQQSLPAQMLAAGFDPTLPAVFAWLGVTVYLTLTAFRKTVAFIAGQASGSSLVFDYGQPRSVLPPDEQLARDSLAARVQQAGEPFQLAFTPAELATELAAFHNLEDLGAAEMNARYFADRSDQLRWMGAGGRICSAWL